MSNSVNTQPFLVRNARLAFVQVFEKRAFSEEMEPVYSLTLLLDPNDPENKKSIETIKNHAKDMMKEAWGSTRVQIKHCCFGDADEDGLAYDGFEGMFYVRLKNKRRPLALDRQRTPISAEDNVLYSGCYGNVSMDMWCQKSSKFGKNISGNLRGVQFMRDAEPFVGSKVSENEFEDESEKEDELAKEDEATPF